MTQRHKREAKGASPLPPPLQPTRPQSVCHGCGTDIRYGRTHGVQCAAPLQTERIMKAAQVARVAAHSAQARAKQSDTVRQRRKEQSSWSQSSQPEWLTVNFYVEKIRPALASVSNSAIACRIGVSRCHASQIRSGKRRAHPRHWRALAELALLSGGVGQEGFKAVRSN